MNNSSFCLQPGEWCTEDFQRISGLCSLFHRDPNGPMFQFSGNPCTNDNHERLPSDDGHRNNSDRSNFDPPGQRSQLRQTNSNAFDKPGGLLFCSCLPTSLIIWDLWKHLVVHEEFFPLPCTRIWIQAAIDWSVYHGSIVASEKQGEAALVS